MEIWIVIRAEQLRKEGEIETIDDSYHNVERMVRIHDYNTWRMRKQKPGKFWQWVYKVHPI